MYLLATYFCVLTCVLGLKVRVIPLGKPSYETTIPSVEINQNSFKDKITWLYLIKYEESENQIETISDLPDVESINVQSTINNQNVLPTFRNLPKLTQIVFTKNPIIYIKAEAVGSLPIRSLFLSGNQINIIEPKSFGANLTTLYLTCNKLKKFEARWFKNASSLEELDMSGNELTFLQPDALKDFTSLEQIVLSHNRIATIGDGALANRNSLITLYLSDNELVEIPAKAFKEGPLEILSIHLHNNKLTFLSEEFLQKTNSTKARIYGNPWQCSCWDIIRRWNTWVNYEYNKEPEGDPRCVSPLSFQSNCIPVVDHELIEYYEQHSEKRETIQEFCKSNF